MNRKQRQIVNKTIDFVRMRLTGESSGHDWWHVSQVYRNAIAICRIEGGDLFTVSLAALLHDIADYKLHNGDCDKGPKLAARWLRQQSVDSGIIRDVCAIIRDLSFKGAGVHSHMPTLEGKIVQDADRLEAIGATGIARAFAFGGHKGRIIYDPQIKPIRHNSFAAYKKNTAPTINHFFEKLLLLKGLMNTQTGRAVAVKKHTAMIAFLNLFFKECGQNEGYWLTRLKKA